MFEPSSSPRVFYVPPGEDFPKAVVEGLAGRLSGKPPEAWARFRLIGNAGRMLTRIRDELEAAPARLLPKLSLITDLSAFAPDLAPPDEAVSGLRRQLDLEQHLRRLPDLAARFDIAKALAALLDEMDGEGVSYDALAALDVADESGHWKRALEIVKVAAEYLPGQGPEAVFRGQATELMARWREHPPADPILIVGSTGSRGTTSLLMKAVSMLPQGALVLPGLDPFMPKGVWQSMGATTDQEDHPQYRYAALLRHLEVTLDDLEPWSNATTVDASRAQLISLALRPAPVTHHWLSEGPKLGDLVQASKDITLIEAKDQRSEANAIALRLRAAAEAGMKAALITPDRALSRRVSAALARWNLVPDDSAGVPLSLTPPGRLLCQLSELGAKGVSSDRLIALLKHPLVASGGNRGEHLLTTRALELKLRRFGPPFPASEEITRWAEEDDKRQGWGAWLAPLLAPNTAETLSDHVAWMASTAEVLCAGPGVEGSGELWDEAPGRKAHKVVSNIAEIAQTSDALTPSDFVTVLRQTLASHAVRILNDVHPDLMVWGTLEARAQGADVVILGGLTDGIWPPATSADPWMNRAMRAAAGLLSPERQIGLSAHDFQQAACAKEVWLTRATKSDDSETVPSRWLNRLLTLLKGLPDQGGEAAINAMTQRGNVWLDMAARLDIAERVDNAPRPSPVPPASVRPEKLSVTEIRTLIRDPYAIYAKHVLRLRELDPLAQSPDARLRGIVIHDVMEQIVADMTDDPDESLTIMEQAAERVLEKEVPWPAARAFWKARFMRAAPWFVATEVERRRNRAETRLEVKGAQPLSDLPFTLTGKADRIDIGKDGRAAIYDYKTGTPPSADEQKHFDKQLPLEAAMVERGAFEKIGQAPVEKAAYIGLGSKPEERSADLDADYWHEFIELIRRMHDPDHGFTSRRAMQKDSDKSPYDLLARFGEWGPADTPRKERL